MDWQNDIEANCLAKTYNLMPARIISPSRKRLLDHGKYEPDDNIYPAIRCMILAHWKDATNILVQYDPTQLDI